MDQVHRTYQHSTFYFFNYYYYYQLDIKSSLTKISAVWQSTASMAVVYIQLKQTHLHYKVYMNLITVIVVTFYLSLSLLLFSLFHFFFMTIPFSLEPKIYEWVMCDAMSPQNSLLQYWFFYFFIFFILCIVLVTAWAAENGMWQLMHYKPSVIRMTAYNYVAKLLLIIFASGLQWCCQLLVIGQCCQIPRVQNYRIVGEVFDC